MIDDDPLWSRLVEAWRPLKGVASRAVAWLMADLPEIGTYSNKAIAKLAGLAPIANDSGKSSGKRSIRGGRTFPWDCATAGLGLVPESEWFYYLGRQLPHYIKRSSA